MTRIRPLSGRATPLLLKIFNALTRRPMDRVRVADAAWAAAHRYFADREMVESHQTPSRGAA